MLSVVVSLAAMVCPPSLEDAQFPGLRVGIDAGAVLVLAPDAPNAALVMLGRATNANWTTGTYLSPVFDTHRWATFDGLSVTTTRPSGRPLPDARATETFAIDSIDMTANVALFHFEDPTWTTGSLIRDDSSLGNHAVVVDGGVSGVLGGIVGRAASVFTDTCLTIPDSPALRPTDQLTLSAWFFPRVIDGRPQGLVSSRFDYTDRSAFTLFVWTNDHLWVDIDTENERLEGRLPITANEWHHAAMVFDGSQPPASRVRLYLDGQLDGVFPETSSSIPAYGPPVTLGCLPNPSGGTNQSLDGLLDEVAIWRRPLADAEILALYRRGASRVVSQVRFCDDGSCGSNPPFLEVQDAVTQRRSDAFMQYRAFLQGVAGPWPEVERVVLQGTCSVPDSGVDAGEPDGGVDGGSTSDAGAPEDGGVMPDGGVFADGGVLEDGDRQPRRLTIGTGCAGAGASAALPLGLLLLARLRRRGARDRPPPP